MNAYNGTDNLEVMACAVNYNRFLLELVLRRAGRDDRLLDFGAGIGTFAARLADAGLHVACVEPDPEQAARIVARGLTSRVTADDYEQHSFDFAYSFNVFEHIEDDVAAMRQVHRLLRPGGRLLAYVPAFGFLYTAMDTKVGHVRRYTRSSLVRALASASFEIEESHYADVVGVPATLSYKILGGSGGTINERALIAYDRIAFPVSLALDRVMNRVIGKNVWAVARKT